MREDLALAKKKTLLLASSLGMFSLSLSTVPEMAVKHGLSAVWAVVPLSLLTAVCMVYTLIAMVQVVKLKSADGQ